MDIVSIVFIFILGTVVGSFVNVVALRHNSGLSSGSSRSICMNCGTQLKWYELIPLFSFFMLRGRCRTCRDTISLQYPVIEFVTGVIFVAILCRQLYYLSLYTNVLPNAMLYAVGLFVYYAVVFCILEIIVIYDIRHTIIPNKFVYTFIVLGILKLLLFCYIKGFAFTTLDLLDICAPLILSLPFALMWLVSDGRWIGFGDAKLAFGIGAMLGFVYGLSSIVLAFWIGAIWSIILLVRNRVEANINPSVTMKSEVPFAPFLVIALCIVFFTHIDVLGLQALITAIF